MTHPAIEFREIGVDFPTLRIPSLKDWAIRRIRGSAESPRFHALRGVSLNVEPGRCVGLIGRNGAGKSTLLRVGAGIIGPSAGEAIIRGSVAPLIELGTGFDAELSGRENIYFNGALLGRSRAEVSRRIDEIIEFSGLGAFIDAPLRTYSTGMTARLAFSIATTVDAQLVLLDEILSVGDASFQQQCEERIQSFYKRGCTILLVSHDLAAIRRMCDEVVWLDHGEVRRAGPPDEVIDAYEAEAIPHEDPLSLLHEVESPVPPRHVLAVHTERAAAEVRVLYPTPEAPSIAATILARSARELYGSALAEFDPLHFVPQGVDVAGCDSLLVFTNPLAMPWRGLLEELRGALASDATAIAAIPVTNLAAAREQLLQVGRPYLTMLQYEESASWHARRRESPVRVTWRDVDPGVFLLRSSALHACRPGAPAAECLSGREVLIVRSAYIHQFPPPRSLARPDLLSRIPEDARVVLEVYCGDGALGAALKERQLTRTVGIEPDVAAAKRAESNYDAVLCGAPAELIPKLTETFDVVVVGERFAEGTEPLSTLAAIREVTAPGRLLLLSVHNVASWPLASDLLQGHFDYAHLGTLTAGSVRFFTTRSIAQLLDASGWEVDSIEPQPLPETAESRRLLRALDLAGVPHDRDSLLAGGYYVRARRRE